MKTFLFILATVMLLFAGTAEAQRHRQKGETGVRGSERLERFRTMRMVEELDLNEEEATRFFAKRNAHEDAVRELVTSRNALLDSVKEMLDDETDPKSYQKSIDRVLATDEKIMAERRRYQDELRAFLTPERFARYLLFERHFGTQMREAMREMRKRPRD